MSNQKIRLVQLTMLMFFFFLSTEGFSQRIKNPPTVVYSYDVGYAVGVEMANRETYFKENFELMRRTQERALVYFQFDYALGVMEGYWLNRFIPEWRNNSGGSETCENKDDLGNCI